MTVIILMVLLFGSFEKQSSRVADTQQRKDIEIKTKS